MANDIFISYRREGGHATAKHLYDLLIRDGYTVSFDIDTLRSGDFDTELLKHVDECTDFILILNETVFERSLDPKCDRKRDWVRNELARALEKKKNVIPIMLNGFTDFPDNLPEDIAEVARKNGPKYDEYYFDDFYRKLKTRFLRTPIPHLGPVEQPVDALVHTDGKDVPGFVYEPSKDSSNFQNGRANKMMIFIAAICLLVGLGLYFFREKTPVPSKVVNQTAEELQDTVEGKSDAPQMTATPDKATAKKETLKPQEAKTVREDDPLVTTYNLGWGKYDGPMSDGKPNGFGGTIIVKESYAIDLKKASGETVQVNPGDKIANVKMENGVLRQGEVQFSDGTRRYLSGL